MKGLGYSDYAIKDIITNEEEAVGKPLDYYDWESLLVKVPDDIL